MEVLITKTELLQADFKKYFKVFKLKPSGVLVSDGENEQIFIVESKLIQDVERYYTAQDGQNLAELIWMNFKRIFEYD